MITNTNNTMIAAAINNDLYSGHKFRAQQQVQARPAQS